MTATHAPDTADKFSRSLIRRTARLLVAEGYFSPSDLDDVAQDLQVALIEQAPKFNPDRAAWSTFVKTVVRSAANIMRRKQQAEIRQKEAETSSLNVLITDEDGQNVELGATISEEEHRTGVGQGTVRHTDEVNLRLDVQAVLDTLTPEMRQLCELLKTLSISDISRELGISRSTINRRIEELRDRFAKQVWKTPFEIAAYYELLTPQRPRIS